VLVKQILAEDRGPRAKKKRAAMGAKMEANRIRKNLLKDKPQRLKPHPLYDVYGTTKVVP
jgi:hypothetical protein